MKSKTKKKVIIGIVVIGILALILSFSGLKLPFASISGCSGGTTILSISNALVTTSNDLSGKQVIRVTAVANGGGECAKIQFTASDLEEKLKENGQEYEVDNNVYGDLITNSQTETFTISNTGNSIYKAYKNEKKTGTLCTLDNCKIDFPSTFSAFRVFVGYPCWCIYDSIYGKDGRFDSSITKDFDVTFKITNLGETTLSSGQQSGTIGDKAFIKWSGDLFAGSWLESPKGKYDAFFRVADNTWYMANTGFAQEINNRYQYDKRNDYGNTGCLIYDNDNCISKYNSFVDLKSVDKTEDYGSSESLIRSINRNGNKYIIGLASYTTWQTFTIDLDASFVGIHKNVGQPEVKCPTETIDVKSGTSQIVNLEVKDISGNNPSFGLALDGCTSGSGILEQSRINNVGTSFQLIKGYASITTTEKDKPFTCKFRAYDINDPTSKGSCILNLLGHVQTGCVANTEKACSSDGSQLGTCNSDGSTFSWVDCKYGCEAFENTYRCRLQSKEICNNQIDDDGNGLIDCADPQCVDSSYCGEKKCADCDAFVMNQIFGSFWKSKSCQKTILQGNTICFLSWIKFALVIVVFLFVLLFGINTSSSFKDKSTKIIAVISTIILSFVLAYLVFAIFVVGVILSVIFLAVSAVIKLFLPTKYLKMLRR